MKAFILCLATLFVAASAQQKCPQNSSGNYPSCKCLNGAVYDANYNWCSTNLNELGGQCPGTGIYPNCNCGVGQKFDVEKKICTDINRSVCPKGSYGDAPFCQCPPTFAFDEVHWFCRPWYLSTTTHEPRIYSPPPPSCGAHQYGTYPDCHYRPCPKHSLTPEDFEPNCRYNFTHHEYTPCPQGLIGYPPNCYKPCPPHHHGKYPNCERVRCPNGSGWSGEFQPDCKYQPSCPPEFPGEWPNCDIYKATKPPTVNTQKPFTTSQVNRYTSTNKPPSTGPTYIPPTSTIAPTYLPAKKSEEATYFGGFGKLL